MSLRALVLVFVALGACHNGPPDAVPVSQLALVAGPDLCLEASEPTDGSPVRSCLIFTCDPAATGDQTVGEIVIESITAGDLDVDVTGAPAFYSFAVDLGLGGGFEPLVGPVRLALGGSFTLRVDLTACPAAGDDTAFTLELTATPESGDSQQAEQIVRICPPPIAVPVSQVAQVLAPNLSLEAPEPADGSPVLSCLAFTCDPLVTTDQTAGDIGVQSIIDGKLDVEVLGAPSLYSFSMDLGLGGGFEPLNGPVRLGFGASFTLRVDLTTCPPVGDTSFTLRLTATPANGGPRQVANQVVRICPAASPPPPALSRIVYESNDEIYWIELDAANTPVDVPLFVTEGKKPVWSPDGTRIAFSDRGQVWVVDPDGGNLTQVTFSPRVEEHVDWSPNGDWLVFDREAGPITAGIKNLWVAAATGGFEEQLTSTTDLDEKANWTANGILFNRGESLFLIQVDDTTPVAPTVAPTPIRDEPFLERNARWSPDNTRIVFTRLRSASVGSLWIMTASIDPTTGVVTAGVPQQLSPNDGNSYKKAAWSPDSNWVVCEGELTTGEENLYIIEVANPANVTQVTTGNDDGSPNWTGP